MFTRHINISKKRSFFLFGARGTGKSTLLSTFFKQNVAYTLDLLDTDREIELSRRPAALIDIVQAQKNKWIVIDEVQKVPALLNIVHKLIETKKYNFALTGSSARKLRRGSANMLAGRASIYNLFPLTSLELDSSFNLLETLSWGTLPEVVGLADSGEKRRFLASYASTYLKEEIIAEQLVRGLEPFRAFLEVAAQIQGQQINFTKIARDVGADTNTIKSYFKILEDTLIGTILPAYHHSVRARQRTAPKFFFFDSGVHRALENLLTTKIQESNYSFGRYFEAFIIRELMAWSSYQENDYRFSYFMTKDGVEIDLVVERPGRPLALIEIKSTRTVEPNALKALSTLGPEFGKAEAFCFSQDTTEKKIQGVRCLPWQKMFEVL